jgi:superfamily II DNA helicase RecQ
MTDLKTLEDYKQYVKDLKSKVRRLQDKNKELVAEVITLKAKSDTRNADATNAVFVTKRATRIQACWRGILARRVFKRMLKNSSKGDEAKKKAYTNQAVMIKAAEAAQKINFTLEMLFRASDVKMSGSVNLEVFKLFLKKIKLPLATSHTAR